MEAALAGPPSSFMIDDEVYELVGSWTCLLKRLPAEGWHLPLLYDLLHPEDADALDDRLDDDEDTLTLAEVETVAARLVTAACGRKPWVVNRLLRYASQEWGALDGALMLRGVDLLTLIGEKPARACNVIYAWLVEGADEKQRDKLHRELFRPPPGEDLAAVPLWTPEEEGTSFMAAMAAQPGRKARRGQPG